MSDRHIVDDICGLHARYADTVLIDRSSVVDDQRAFFRRLCHGALFQSGKPLLIYDEQPPISLAFERVLIAWDGKREASRAVSEALPLICQAKSVNVLSVEVDKGAGLEGTRPGLELSRYLARHQIDVTLKDVPHDGESVHSIIQGYSIECDADLIVTGAYGRSRFRERIFGGTTLDLLNECRTPLLMAH